MSCVRDMMLLSRFTPAVLSTLLLLSACSVSETPSEPSPPEPAPTEPTAEALYSPFVIDVAHDHLPFRQITFKDVGMSLAPEDRAHVYELVAEELREGLSEAGIHARVSHDVRWSEPEHHLACQSEHIYVDMWHGGSEDGSGTWGYSLWSGCEAESEFGRGDVPHEHDGAVAAHPLARHIAQRIQTAADAHCFRKRC